MPSENGGGGTSRCSEGLVATGGLVPSAASRTSPDSARTMAIARLRTAHLHHALNLAQPHGLEELQAVADDARKVQRYRVSGVGMGGKVAIQSHRSEEHTSELQSLR